MAPFWPVKPLAAGLVAASALGLVLFLPGSPAAAPSSQQRLALRGLDKVTGQSRDFQVPVGQAFPLGRLLVLPEACYRNAPEEREESIAFLDIRDRNDGKRLFRGWMFSSSPGLSGLEDPVYDVWVISCLRPGEEAGQDAASAGQDAASPAVTGEKN